VRQAEDDAARPTDLGEGNVGAPLEATILGPQGVGQGRRRDRAAPASPARHRPPAKAGSDFAATMTNGAWNKHWLETHSGEGFSCAFMPMSIASSRRRRSPPLHICQDEDEVFHLAGRMRFRVVKREFELASTSSAHR
jgi:hypothetical protein